MARTKNRKIKTQKEEKENKKPHFILEVQDGTLGNKNTILPLKEK